MAGKDGKLSKSPEEIGQAFTEAVDHGGGKNAATNMGVLMVSSTIGLLLLIAVVAVWRGRRSKDDAAWRLVWVVFLFSVALVLLFAFIALTTVRVS